MKKIIDISVPLENGMVAWPGSVGFHLTQTMKMSEGDIANNSRLDSDVHIGTHIDAPWHSIPNGSTIEQLDLHDLIGLAYVVDLTDAEVISDAELELSHIPLNVERLLIKTKNSELWKNERKIFNKNFVGLNPRASEWVSNRNIRLVGIDYLSVQTFSEKSMTTHNILLKKEIVIVEGLDLSDVNSGYYELLCLPIKLVGAEGAPARVVLREV